MKHANLLMPLFLILSSISCDLDPILDLVNPSASFSFSNNNCVAPCIINFSNTSQNASSYSWDFGDEGTSMESSPSHEYTSGGTYTVRLKAFGTDGGIDSSSQTVSIQAGGTDTLPSGSSLVAGFNISNISNNQYAPAIVDFENTSQNAASFHWIFGDGTASFDQHPGPHTYLNPGTYTVRLSVSDDDSKTDTALQTLNILKTPTFKRTFEGGAVSINQRENGQYVLLTNGPNLAFYDANGNFENQTTANNDGSAELLTPLANEEFVCVIEGTSLYKLNLQGTVLFSKDYSIGQIISLLELEDETIVLLGYNRDSNLYTLIRTDQLGNTFWTKEISDIRLIGDIAGTIRGQFLAKNGSSSFLILGNASIGGDAEYRLINFDLNGNSLWDKTFNTPTLDDPRSILPNPAGGFVILGSQGGAYSSGAHLLLVDENGNYVSEKLFKENSGDFIEVFYLVPSTVGGFGIVGYFGDFEGMYLAKTDEEGNKLWENINCTAGVGISIYPTLDGGLVGLNRGGQILKLDAFGNL